MPSKNQIKLIQSLKLKKHRDSQNIFVAEGEKLVSEIIRNKNTKPLWIFHTSDTDTSIISGDYNNVCEVVTEQELKKVSFLSTPNKIVGVFSKFECSLSNLALKNDVTLCMDEVQDPGNMGTIIRLADWFGIKNIVCSPNSADIYNPKVVQATMGAIARVNINYAKLTDFIKQYVADTGNPVYGTFLNGDNIYSSNIEKKGLIIMGNEGKGISDDVSELVTDRLLIPNYSDNNTKSESLNVGIAAGIICSEFRRR